MKVSLTGYVGDLEIETSDCVLKVDISRVNKEKRILEYDLNYADNFIQLGFDMYENNKPNSLGNLIKDNYEDIYDNILGDAIYDLEDKLTREEFLKICKLLGI